MLKISYAGCPGLGAIHSWNACRSAKLRKKFTKTCYFI